VGDKKQLSLCDEALMKIKTAFSLWAENTNRKRVPADGHTIGAQVLSVYRHLSGSVLGMRVKGMNLRPVLVG
jgi:hypothetical protein